MSLHSDTSHATFLQYVLIQFLAAELFDEKVSGGKAPLFSGTLDVVHKLSQIAEELCSPGLGLLQSLKYRLFKDARYS
jgi:hypothetical protein